MKEKTEKFLFGGFTPKAHSVNVPEATMTQYLGIIIYLNISYCFHKHRVPFIGLHSGKFETNIYLMIKIIPFSTTLITQNIIEVL